MSHSSQGTEGCMARKQQLNYSVNLGDFCWFLPPNTLEENNMFMSVLITTANGQMYKIVCYIHNDVCQTCCESLTVIAGKILKGSNQQ